MPKVLVELDRDLHGAVQQVAEDRRCGVVHVVRHALVNDKDVKRKLGQAHAEPRSAKMYGHGPSIQREEER